MPLYEYACNPCDKRVEEIRRIGDLDPPSCPICKEKMERVFSSPIVIDRSKVPEKLKKRSEEQGKKFYRRYPQYQDLVTKTLSSKP